MEPCKKIIFPINPQTWTRVLPNEKIFFKIPEICRKGRWKKGCAEYKKTGLCKHTLSKSARLRLARIRRYNKYKIDVLTLAKAAGFQLPIIGWALYFYYPVPKRWSQKKKRMMHGQPMLSKPDLDNCEKAFYDSISVQDERVAQLSGHGKFWVNQEKGYIEVLLNQPLYNPFGVEFIDQSVMLQRTKPKGKPRGKHARKEKAPELLFAREDKIK